MRYLCLVLVLVGCDTASPGTDAGPMLTCSGSAMQVCSCPDGSGGWRYCRSDDTWGPCECMGTDSGVPPPPPACGIRAGTWEVSGMVLASSTRADCVVNTAEITVASIDQMAGVGTCVAGCSCADTPATAPDCTASWAASCTDGSGASQAVTRTSETTASGFYHLEPSTDGSFCEFNMSVRWVR